MAHGGTSHAQRELEAKYDVDADWALPALDRLVPDGSVESDVVRVCSTYYDTTDRHLLGTRLTLRRRTGDIDVGWQLKVPDGDARIELRWPLGTGRGVPAEIRDVTSGVRGRSALRAVATLDVERRRARLLDASGSCVAEVVDDLVTATGGEGRSSWREVEVELVDGSPGVLARAYKLLVRAGAARSTSKSKLGRALGNASGVARPAGSLAAVVGAYLDRQWEAIVRGDLGVRRGELPLHATRTAIRRYRSVLRVLAPVLDATRAAALDDDLRALAAALGEVRDIEVLRSVLADLLASLPADVDPEPARRTIDAALTADHEASVAALLARLRSARHTALLSELRAWHDDVPVDPELPAGAVLRYVRRADKQARKRLAAVPRHHHADDERMHRARKAAKRARYVAELADARGVGERSRSRSVARRNKKVQRRLGSRQDAVVAMAYVGRLGVERADADAAFALGVLHELCRARAES